MENIMKVKKVEFTENTERHTKMYIFIKDETILQNLNNRHNRPYETYKKEIVPQVINILKEQGIDIEGMKISWSQYAGCKCGCSPGFILKGGKLDCPLDIFVTI
jgi:hypothetical protein